MIVGKNIAIIGAGNTAMDASRTARRLSTGRVRVIYRRSIHEVPARAEEFEHAQQEGVEFLFLTAPIRILGNEDGWVRAIEVQKCDLGEPDESGRARPVPIEGSNYVIEVDTIINAVGTSSNKTLFQSAPDIQRDKRGYLIADPDTLATSKPGVYGGGDIVGGGATVIKAMGDGRKGAKAINEYLKTLPPKKPL
jgi:glutamate synthase (NADPH/NADH) small chain